MKLRLQVFLCILGFSIWTTNAVDLHYKRLVNSEERIKSHGYAAESHSVETSDGFVLKLFRLPYSHKLKNQDKYRPAILLQHGLLSNSDCWLNSGPDNSLAYNLVDAGYDVWLGNARGNTYSKKNTKVSVNSPKFWEFSWHEIGVLDIAAMIDYILDETDQDAIHFAGHSQGTTAYFVLMSVRPEYNAKIKSAHMLAPCAYFGHGTSFVFKLLEPLVGTPGGMWNALFSDMELIPKTEVVSRAIDTSCGEGEHRLGKYCHNMYMQVVGDGYENMNETSLQVLLDTHPGSISSNQGIHYIQLHTSGKFRQYDHGEKKNIKAYGQSSPPDYDLSKIVAPTYLYSSQNDALCGPEDVKTLEKNLIKMAGHYRMPNPSWNHLDFITARQIKEELNNVVIAACNKHEKF